MSEKIKITVTAPEQLINAIAQEVLKIINSNDNLQQIETIKSDDGFTVKEVAEKLKCQPQTIRIHINKGLLKANKPGKSWRITQKQIDDYVKSN